MSVGVNHSINWKSEYSLIVLFLYCNNKTYTNHQAYDKDSNGKNGQMFKQSYNATEQHHHCDNKHCFSKGFSVG